MFFAAPGSVISCARAWSSAVRRTVSVANVRTRRESGRETKSWEGLWFVEPGERRDSFALVSVLRWTMLECCLMKRLYL
eukprot:COSAG02_NODE_5764_length_4058_cov_1.871937_2_plen_79_part_00